MDIKRIPIEEFRNEGFLQEANRQFFHPLGLALEMHTGFGDREDVGRWLAQQGVQFGPDAVDCVWTFVSLMGLNKPFLGGIQDYRDDPEGVCFDAGVLDARKADYVNQERMRHAAARHDLMGNIVQPVDWVPPT